MILSHAGFRVILQEEWELWQHVKEGLKILLNTRIRRRQENSAVQQNSSCAEEMCVYQFVLLDWFEEFTNTTPSNVVVTRWRPLLQIEASKRHRTNGTRIRSPFLLVPLVPLLKDWARIKEEGVSCDLGDDDTCVDTEQSGKSLRLVCRLTLGRLANTYFLLNPFAPLTKSKITLPTLKKRIHLVDQ